MKKYAFYVYTTLIICLLSFTTVMATVSEHNETITYRSLSIVVNGSEIAPCDEKGVSTEPFIRNEDGSTYLPIRAVAGALGLDVGWDDATSTVILKSGGVVKQGPSKPVKTDRVEVEKLTMRDIKITLDGKKVNLINANGDPVEPFIKNDSTFIPVRAVATALGCDVKWNGTTSTVTINDGNVLGGTENPENPDAELSAEQISRKCSDGVFSIMTYSMNGKASSTGSGFFIDSNGIAVTNLHVVEDCSNVIVQTTDGKIYSDVNIIDYSKEDDLALLKVKGSGFVSLEIGSSSGLRQGQVAYALGSPYRLSNTMSQGIIANPIRVISGTEYIQISVPITNGSSGGALLDTSGKVIGVTCAGFIKAGADLNLAVPAEKIKKLDKNSNDDWIVYSGDSYEGYESVPDFGVLSGVKLIYTEKYGYGDYYEYDLNDFCDRFNNTKLERKNAAIKAYRESLDWSGFKQVSKEGENNYVYESDNEFLSFNVDEKEETISVYVEKKAEFYTRYEGLPDFGWLSGLDADAKPGSNKSCKYTYEWRTDYTYSSIMEKLGDYYDFLDLCDFVQVSEDENGATYKGNGLTIKCSVEGKYVYIDVSTK